MNKLIEKDKLLIENMIYEIRGLQVMLDSDLAKLYQCTNGTKDIIFKINPGIILVCFFIINTKYSNSATIITIARKI